MQEEDKQKHTQHTCLLGLLSNSPQSTNERGKEQHTVRHQRDVQLAKNREDGLSKTGQRSVPLDLFVQLHGLALSNSIKHQV